MLKHGHRRRGTYDAVYQAWKQMKARCYQRGNKRFKNYGARGITVCERWRNSFEAFLNDIGPKPSSQHSLHRIDNDRDYEPGNVKWATMLEQMRNRQNSRWVVLNGQRIPLGEACEILGIKKSTYLMRLHYGWTEAEALSGVRHAKPARPKA